MRTDLRVKLREEQAELLEDLSGRQFGVAGEEPGEHAWSLCVCGVEALPCDFAQDLVAELGVVELLREHVKTLCHMFREVLVVLEGLHDGDLGGEAVCVVLYGEADCLVDPKANLLLLHVLLILGDVIYWS